MNVTKEELFFDDWRAYTYIYSAGFIGMSVGLYANPNALPLTAGMALLFMALTVGTTHFVADPDENPPGQRKWESFKQKLDDRAGGWGLYIGAVYITSAWAVWYRPYWDFPVPFAVVLGCIGFLLIGYDTLRRGVMK